MQIIQIQDTVLNLYLGININTSDTDANNTLFGNVLFAAEKIIPDYQFNSQRLLDRNLGKYHITVFNAAECAKYPQLLTNAAGLQVKNTSLTFKGIGSISDKGMTTYFVVVESAVLNKFRTDANLPEKDFHITLAFTHKDLFSQAKTECNVLKLNHQIL